MSIFGWSYPAGCSGPPDTDSPDDALADAITDMLAADLHHNLFEFCSKLRSDAYAKGYHDGKSDEGLARDYNQQKELPL